MGKGASKLFTVQNLSIYGQIITVYHRQVESRSSSFEKKWLQFKVNVKGGPTLNVSNFSEAEADKTLMESDSILGLHEGN